MTNDSKPNPDIKLDLGYDVKTQRVSFSLGLSNVFNNLGKKQFGFSVSRWFTRSRGKADAKLGLPATSDTDPSPRERDIWTQRDTQAATVTRHVDSAVKATSEWIEDHCPERLSAERLQSDIDSKLKEVFGYYHRRFEKRRDDLADSLQAYETFRTDHGLDRPAQVPLFFLRPFAMLAGAMLAETLANAALFAGISSQGLIGGWVTAVIVSVVNILLGLVFGLLVIRYGIAWTDWRRKVLIGVGVFLALSIVFFNLYVAHFREIAEQAVLADQAGDAAITREHTPGFGDAWPHFLANPFDLGSVLGIGLFVIGLVIAGFATYEGYKGFTDPFPGYGARGKRFYINRLLRQHTEDTARSLCYRALDRARAQIDSSAGHHVHFKSEVFKAQAELERLHKGAKQAEGRVNNYAWQLVNDYRGANKLQRARLAKKAKRSKSGMITDPGPPPAYFSVDLRTSGHWKSAVPAIDECLTQARAATQIIEANLRILEVTREYISSLRHQAPNAVAEKTDVIASQMDPTDLRLREEVERAMARRRGLKVISGVAAKA